MQRSREAIRSNDDARPRDDELVAAKQEHAVVPDGGYGGERLPHAALAVELLGLERVAVMKLEDHLRRPRQDHFGAHLHRLPVQIAERVGSAGELEQIVEEPVPAAGVNVAQRARVPAEYQQRLRSRSARDTRANARELLLD